MTHTFKLERLDGTPADPPSFKTTVLAWKPGDTIPLSARRAWRKTSAGQSEPTYVLGGGSLNFDPRGVVFPHSRQRLYAYLRSTTFSHRWPIGHRQKHRKCDALTPRA